MYVSYAEYKAEGGTLLESEFNKYAKEAEKKVSLATNKRMYNAKDSAQESVKECIIKLCEILYKKEEERIKSFSHDGLSQTYIIKSGKEYAQKEQELLQAYLLCEEDGAGVPLLYRGCKR